MPTASITFIASIAGFSVQSSRTLTGTAHEGGQYPAAAPEGCTYGGMNVYDSLHTFTFEATPTLEEGDVFAVFWTGGRRAELVVEGVDGLAVTVHNDDIGQGDALPASGTAMVASPRARNDLRFATSTLVALIAAADIAGAALLVFTDAADATVLVDLASESYAAWDDEDGTDSPLADLANVETLDVYGATALTVTLGLLQDSAL